MPTDLPGKTNTQCLCPNCSNPPGYTYTAEFRFDCMAREFGRYSPKQRENFLSVFKRTGGWEKRLLELETRVEQLKADGQFDTEYWINKTNKLLE